MSITRMTAIILIFALACAGWMLLGATTQMRSTNMGGRLGAQVEQMWGIPLIQEAPSLSIAIPGTDRVRWIMPTKNEIEVALATDYRKKGLIWYSTYTCAFDGAYTLSNQEAVSQKVRVHFSFPAKHGTYDEFELSVDDRRLQSPVDVAQGVDEIVELKPGQEARFRIAYRTRGLREWRYRMDSRVGRVQGLDLAIRTNFRNVDYPDGCLSPMSREETEEGLELRWQATDLITREDIGIILPEKLNPGPLTSRITFFAPVCLIFFFVLVASVNILRQVNVHPMHYLFVAAGFFAFHLLLAYMAGLINIHLAFLISSIVSVSLVTGYLSAALRGRFPWRTAAAAQVFFLVLFSYSFFLKGITGLTVAVGSVVTLAVLMKMTAHVDWDAVFAKTTPHSAPIPDPPPFTKAVPPSLPTETHLEA